MKQNLLLHVPHSSTRFPEESSYSFHSLNQEELLLIDYYTDELFVPDPKTDSITPMVFPYCRLYCDVERLINDPLEKVGLGISYAWRDPASGELRNFSTLPDAFCLYADFHAEVSKKLTALQGSTLLIDCHSFSALPNLLVSCPPDIDICIGNNEDESFPGEETIRSLVQFFKSKGYKVGINAPFSNSKTFSVPVKYHSVMIEVNKRLYMNEHTLEKTPGFHRLRSDILEVISNLL
ncbi:MAG: N-formylglutamate amidohydrolase [Bacteroidaceae bacterium]|nr:N-formylglutamate amidohydrolase [Bacteroidaceae bacterium]